MSNAILHNTITKVYPPEDTDKYRKELFFYQNFQGFAPKLIAFGKNALIMEKCTPIMEIEGSARYAEQLLELLQRLHEAGANHRDIALSNVVVKDDKVLLIDWESATTDISKISVDLRGAREAGVPPLKSPNPETDYTEDGIWWNGPWEHCPGPYWGSPL